MNFAMPDGSIRFLRRPNSGLAQQGGTGDSGQIRSPPSPNMTNGRKASCSDTRSAYRLATMSIAELRKLPADEKLRIIEALWGDIAADEETFQSPAWHEAELRKTEADLAAGRIEMLDWEDAKKELRKRFE